MTQSYAMDMEMEQDSGRYNHDNGKFRSSPVRSRSKVGMCLAVIALLISLVAFILTVIILADPQLVPAIKENYPSDGAKAEGETSGAEKEPEVEPEGNKMAPYSSDSKARDDHTYVFAMYGNYPPLTFLTDLGRTDGFNLDIITVLCRRAKKRCRYSIFDNFKVIWDSDQDTSEGLNRRFFDGGLAFFTDIRMTAYAYSEPMFKRTMQGSLYQKAGGSYTEEGANTLKVGFRSGFFTSAACLGKELGGALKEENVFLFQTEAEIVDAMNDGTIDLIFSAPTPGLAAFETIKMITSCSDGRVGVMTRKGSPMLPWFNAELKEMKKDGALKEICEKALTKYNIEDHHCAL